MCSLCLEAEKLRSCHPETEVTAYLLLLLCPEADGRIKELVTD